MRIGIVKEIAPAILVCTSAVLFRLWFITLVPQPYMYDQFEYESYALKMWNSPHFLAEHTYRSYPFPLMMVFVYLLSGWGNHQALYIAHAVLEGLTAVIVYILLRQFRIPKTTALLGSILYAVNPFTSGYVGVVLSEILATFTIAVAIFSGVLFIKKPVLWSGLLLGLFAGLSAQVRVAAFIWSAIPLVFVISRVRVALHKLAYLGVAAGVFLTFLYPLYTNWNAYRVLSISKVDNLFAMELFNGATLKILPPFTRLYPREQYEMWVEYWSEYHPEYTQETRNAIARKYLDKAITIIRQDPLDYMRWRIFKAWYVWQKENIFFYEEPGWESRRVLVFTVNFAIIAFSALGLLSGRILANKPSSRYIYSCLLFTILYGIFAFSLTHAEYRLTIPFYPVLIVLAILGAYSVYRGVRRLVPKKVR